MKSYHISDIKMIPTQLRFSSILRTRSTRSFCTSSILSIKNPFNYPPDAPRSTESKLFQKLNPHVKKLQDEAKKLEEELEKSDYPQEEQQRRWHKFMTDKL